MGKSSSSRSNQRKHALRILFEIDINQSSVADVLEGKRKAGEEIPQEFAMQLVAGVIKNREKLDETISGYSEGWELSRMPLVDRNILRMSVYELFFLSDIPPAATIDEAVELAKVFSTEDSGKFVNGVLGKINRDSEKLKKSLSGT